MYIPKVRQLSSVYSTEPGTRLNLYEYKDTINSRAASFSCSDEYDRGGFRSTQTLCWLANSQSSYSLLIFNKASV